MRMTKEARLKLLDGVNVMKLSRNDLINLIGEGLKPDSVRRFITLNNIGPKSKPYSKNSVLSKSDVQKAITRIKKRKLKLTYQRLGEELKVSRQRACAICKKLELTYFFGKKA